MAKLLLQNGVDAEPDPKKPALELAALYGHEDVVRLILDARKERHIESDVALNLVD